MFFLNYRFQWKNTRKQHNLSLCLFKCFLIKRKKLKKNEKKRKKYHWSIFLNSFCFMPSTEIVKREYLAIGIWRVYWKKNVYAVPWSAARHLAVFEQLADWWWLSQKKTHVNLKPDPKSKFFFRHIFCRKSSDRVGEVTKIE